MAERRTSVRLSVVGGSQVRAELASIGSDGQRSLERIARATQPAGVGLRALDAVAGEARQQIDAFAGRAGPAGAALGVMGPAGLAAAAGIGAMVAAIGVGLRDLAEAERLSIRLDQVLRATGYAAGLTGADIGAMADDIERATFATAEEVQQAAGVLATFRSVQGDTFREALVLAQDLSAVFGQSLTGSVTQLGKALEDPIDGITALRRVGVSFTDSQREVIETLVETGRTAEAQGVILQVLADQVGGAGAAEAGGHAGAWNRAADAVGNFLEKIAEVSGAAATVRGALNLIAGGLEAVNAAMGEVAVGQQLVEANQELQRCGRSRRGCRALSPRLGRSSRGGQVEQEIRAVEERIDGPDQVSSGARRHWRPRKRTWGRRRRGRRRGRSGAGAAARAEGRARGPRHDRGEDRRGRDAAIGDGRAAGGAARPSPAPAWSTRRSRRRRRWRGGRSRRWRSRRATRRSARRSRPRRRLRICPPRSCSSATRGRSSWSGTWRSWARARRPRSGPRSNAWRTSFTTSSRRSGRRRGAAARRRVPRARRRRSWPRAKRSIAR